MSVIFSHNIMLLQTIRAREAVVSNASIWDTSKLLPNGMHASQDWQQAADETQPIESFMHLHLGIDADGLPDDLQCHHLFVQDWSDIEASQNVSIASIPTVFDSSLAPKGKAAVHAYTAANEPWELWHGVDPRSKEYKQRKEERAEVLWQQLERVRTRCHVALCSMHASVPAICTFALVAVQVKGQHCQLCCQCCRSSLQVRLTQHRVGDIEPFRAAVHVCMRNLLCITCMRMHAIA